MKKTHVQHSFVVIEWRRRRRKSVCSKSCFLLYRLILIGIHNIDFDFHLIITLKGKQEENFSMHRFNICFSFAHGREERMSLDLWHATDVMDWPIDFGPDLLNIVELDSTLENESETNERFTSKLFQLSYWINQSTYQWSTAFRASFALETVEKTLMLIFDLCPWSFSNKQIFTLTITRVPCIKAGQMWWLTNGAPYSES